MNGDKGNIIVFDELLGKPLEIEFVHDWKFWWYFLIEDEGMIQRLEERYQAIKSAPPLKTSGGNR